jgi:hypothetical protein
MIVENAAILGFEALRALADEATMNSFSRSVFIRGQSVLNFVSYEEVGGMVDFWNHRKLRCILYRLFNRKPDHLLRSCVVSFEQDRDFARSLFVDQNLRNLVALYQTISFLYRTGSTVTVFGF